MSEAVALADPPRVELAGSPAVTDAGADPLSSATQGAPARGRASGRFRLIHYVSLVSLAFVLAIATVWVQVSCVRQGYLVEDARRELEAQRHLLQRKGMQFEEMTYPIALHAIYLELKEKIDELRPRNDEESRR